MTTFLDGPAQGTKLELRRAPVFLRVVQHRELKTVDALDQLDDEPRPTEDIFVYMLVEPSQTMFVCRRGRNVDGSKAVGGMYSHGVYKLYSIQPNYDILRDFHKWEAWTRDQWENLPKEEQERLV